MIGFEILITITFMSYFIWIGIDYLDMNDDLDDYDDDLENEEL